MAGGMSSRRGVPLKDRPVVRGPGWLEPEEASAPPQSPPPAPGPGRRRRHCWVTHPDHVGELEGLVLQWAQDDGWVALVQYVLEQPGGPTAVQEWIPATRLRPV